MHCCLACTPLAPIVSRDSDSDRVSVLSVCASVSCVAYGLTVYEMCDPKLRQVYVSGERKRAHLHRQLGCEEGGGGGGVVMICGIVLSVCRAVCMTKWTLLFVFRIFEVSSRVLFFTSILNTPSLFFLAVCTDATILFVLSSKSAVSSIRVNAWGRAASTSCVRYVIL